MKNGYQGFLEPTIRNLSFNFNFISFILTEQYIQAVHQEMVMLESP